MDPVQTGKTDMRELLTGDDIFSTVITLRASDDRAIVLVEGYSDAQCLGPHIDMATATIVPCHGSENLDRAIALVDRQGVAGTIAIRDADWFGILFPTTTSDNVAYTELYDLDATILLHTDAGRRVSLVFGQPDRIAADCAAAGVDSPVDLAVRVAGRLGLLRLASSRHGLALSLRDFPIHEIIDATRAPNDERMVALAISRTRNASVTSEELRLMLSAEADRKTPLQRVCSGHDVAATLGTLCRTAWGAGSVGRDLILQAVRAALSCAELRTLSIYMVVCAWEERSGYVVWSCREPLV